MTKIKTIYLDYAAATPLDAGVLAAMMPYFSDDFYNPSAFYSAAEAVKKQLAKARQEVAGVLGARPAEIVFTSGGTEANNLAINGVMKDYPEANLVVSAIEHDSVLQPAKQWQSKVLAVKKDGLIEINALADLIDDNTVLVSINYANNEIGVIEPIGQIARQVSKIRQDRLKEGNNLPLYLHADAAQAANYLDLHVARLGVDLMSLNGGKLYGPKGSGALYVRSGTSLQSQIRGGGQERDLRSGTENVAGLLGFSWALQLAQAMRSQESPRLYKLQQYFMVSLKEKIPTISFNGSLKQRLVNNVHVTIPDKSNERLLIGLDQAGVLAAAGSACSAADDQPSHVLAAIGLSDEAARSSLRFSLGRMTTKADLDFTLKALVKLVGQPT